MSKTIRILRLVKVDSKYCDYLRNFELKVPYNMNQKSSRPFVGILFEVNNYKYFAPLTSPKPKHLKMKNTKDFLKLDDGKLGAINFNNMIPVLDDNIQLLDLDNNINTNYSKLLREQIYWLIRNDEVIYDKSRKLYDDYINNKLYKQIKDRCCDFPLLEIKCQDYKIINK